MLLYAVCYIHIYTIINTNVAVCTIGNAKYAILLHTIIFCIFESTAIFLEAYNFRHTTTTTKTTTTVIPTDTAM